MEKMELKYVGEWDERKKRGSFWKLENTEGREGILRCRK